MEENHIPQPPYQQPYPPQPQYPAPYEDASPLSIGSYLVMMFVGAIPVVGLILMLVWAFGGNTNINRRNYARATLILMAVGIVLTIVFGGAFFAAVSNISSGTISGGATY